MLILLYSNRSTIGKHPFVLSTSFVNKTRYIPTGTSPQSSILCIVANSHDKFSCKFGGCRQLTMTPARLFTVARFFRVNQFLEKEKNAMKNLMMNFLNDDQGQDLIEYTLLLAFVALASAAVFIGSGNSISGIWTAANTKLANANTTAAS